MRAPSSTCAKAQTRVPGPMSLDSTRPAGCVKNRAGAAVEAVLMVFLPVVILVVILKPVRETLDAGRQRRRGPEPRRTPEVLDVGVGRDHIARLERHKPPARPLPERPLERADELHQAHRRTRTDVE